MWSVAKHSTGMKQTEDRKHRGRTSISNKFEKSPTKPDVPISRRTQSARPITANGNMGKHRGDRRDMSKTYTNNAVHRSRGSDPRPDVKTRKR